MPGAGTLHVLLLHQLFVAEDEAGGTRHYELARHLGEAGERVTVVASPLSYLTGRRLAEGRGVRAHGRGVVVRRVWTYAPRRQGFAGRVLGFLSFTASSFLAGLRTPDVDVVWGTTPPLFQAAAAWAVARLRRVPFVLEVRDLWPDFAVALGVLRNRTAIAAARALEGFLYRRADLVIVNSPGFVEHIAARGAARERIAVVPNGVEAEAFDPAARGDAFRREVGAGPADVLVVYAGAHGVPNDLDVVLDAADRLRDDARVRFALVGGGRDKARLQRRATELGLANLRFVDPQPKSRMPEVLAAADLSLAILRPLDVFKTTYPNKVFDGMAAGRPTLLAIDGVIRRVVEEADGGSFVPPGDPEALAAAIARYAAEPELRARQGRSARLYVERHFRREEQAESLRGLLRGVAGR